MDDSSWDYKHSLKQELLNLNLRKVETSVYWELQSESSLFPPAGSNMSLCVLQLCGYDWLKILIGFYFIY